jgi:hypothetical protein
MEISVSWPQSKLKWFGLVLVLAGLGLIPIAMLTLENLRPSVNYPELRGALALLLALGDGFLIAGVLIMMPQVRIAGRSLNQSEPLEH